MSGSLAANRLIPDPSWKETMIKKSGATVKDIMQAILYADEIAFEDTKAYSEQFDFSRYEDFRELWSITRRKIRYQLDAAGMEVIKSPAATWWSGYADCKSKSLFIGSVLKNAGIDYFYRLVHFGNPSQAHVYPVAISKEHGEVILDSVYEYFDQEAKYAFKIDYDPASGKTFNQVGRLPKKWSFLKIIGWSLLFILGLKILFNQ